MNAFVIVGIALVVLLVILLFMVMGSYNGLVALRNVVKNAFAQIDVQLQRRYDLIPNLVEVAKKYMSHERDTLEAVIAARNMAASAAKVASQDPTSPGAMKNLLQAEGSLGGVLVRLFAVSEAYPDLKADGQMTQLMNELSSTEDRVAFSRQAYNDAVMQYNTKRETFPTVIIAGIFRFEKAESFQVESEESRKAPQVQF